MHVILLNSNHLYFFLSVERCLRIVFFHLLYLLDWLFILFFRKFAAYSTVGYSEVVVSWFLSCNN